MKLFKTLFNLAKLPVAIAADVLCALPDSSAGRDVGERTRKACDEVDDTLEDE